MSRQLTSLAVLATLACAALAADARAGVYDVLACWDGAPNRSWQASTSGPYTHAWAACPSSETTIAGHPNEGMTASNTLGPSLAPGFATARVSFTAPFGTRVVRVRGDIKLDSTGGWRAGLFDDAGGQWLMCCSTLNTWQPLDVGRGTTRLSAVAVCERGSGCTRDLFRGYAVLRRIVVTLEENSAPSVVIRGGALVAPGWQRLQRGVVVDRSDPIGIRSTTVSIDGRPVVSHRTVCDATLPIPCENVSSTLAVDTRTVGDGRHALRIDAVDSAGNATALQRVIAVDNHAPAAPIALATAGGRGWRSQPEFALRWRYPRQAAAPVTGAYVQLCPSRGVVGSCQPPQWLGHVDRATIRVARAGEWRARVWLKDAAGNVSSANAAETPLRVDDAAPAIFFQKPRPERPALVRVTAVDDRSGIAARELLIRRRGSSAWLSLPVTSQPGGFGAVIDDEALPRGIYQLRARAVDQAGNERTTEQLADGKKAELALPLRVPTTLRVGQRTRVRAGRARGRRRYRSKLVKRPRAKYGRTIPLRGRLTMPGGNPLATRDVQVYERTKLAAAPWRLVAAVRTSRTGRFLFRALRGPSRTLRFRYGGSDTIRGATTDVRLAVRAATTIRASRRRVVNGEDVTFRGRLLGQPLPSPGKLIELQAYARGHWLTFRTVRASARSGRWAFTYRFSATRGNVRYRFRARVPREAAYPFETGVSRQVGVRVRGL